MNFKSIHKDIATLLTIVSCVWIFIGVSFLAYAMIVSGCIGTILSIWFRDDINENWDKWLLKMGGKNGNKKD